MKTKQKMITRLKNDHVIKQTLCGEIHEILLGTEYTPNIAIALNIGPTTAHYHKEIDEIYFVLDGDILLKLYNPETGEYTDQKLSANELCLITKGIHHKIIESSKENRLCVISIPYFNGDDEYISEKL
jgi:mannose-6-phosphate isomerase-like protein (cupin superfamily)